MPIHYVLCHRTSQFSAQITWQKSIKIAPYYPSSFMRLKHNSCVVWRIAFQSLISCGKFFFLYFMQDWCSPPSVAFLITAGIWAPWSLEVCLLNSILIRRLSWLSVLAHQKSWADWCSSRDGWSSLCTTSPPDSLFRSWFFSTNTTITFPFLLRAVLYS
jgi:hypothetical protein